MEWQNNPGIIHRTSVSLKGIQGNFRPLRIPQELQADTKPAENVWAIIKQDLDGKFPERRQRRYGKSITGSSIIKIILGILFEGFLNSILSVSGLKSEGRCPFFKNEVSVILDKFSSYLCVLLLFTTYTGNI